VADYDQLLYDDFPFSESHPDNLAAIATLFGMDPPPLERARILELGCGLGGNIAPYGEIFPEGHFVGVDLSARQIEQGKSAVEALGLTNVDLQARNITDLGAELGVFDYIICHGVYSWVPAPVQERILSLCSELLSPQGLAYVSYNTLPGWHLRGAIRSVLREQVPKHEHPTVQARVARDFLGFWRQHLLTEHSPTQKWLGRELDTINILSDAYLYYEHLVENNEPLWFRDFAARAQTAGLRYVGDVQLTTMLPARYGPGVPESIAARAKTLIESEQHLDFLSLRYFRRSILTRGDVALDRHLTGERILNLRVRSKLTVTDEGLKSDDGHVIDSPDPVVRGALDVLQAAKPQSMSVTELAAAAGVEPMDIAPSLLELLCMNFLDVHRWRRPFRSTPGERPRVSRWARYQAARGDAKATNLRHDSIGLDSLDRVLLPAMDGTRDEAALQKVGLDAIVLGTVQATWEGQPMTDPELIAELIQIKLRHLADAGFVFDDA
jgi:methyltransferase-like protein/trans-aconitate methyltransferase